MDEFSILYKREKCDTIEKHSKKGRVSAMKKRLYRIEEGKMLAGVCGGVAEYFDIDPTIIRLAIVLFSLAGGSGVLLYIIAAIIMPTKSSIM